MSKITQRVLGVVVLLVAGTLSLPATTSFLDAPGRENWIVPVQALVMALVGAASVLALPALAPSGASPVVRALVGAGWGLLAAVVGVLVFWLLINGLTGA